MRYAPVAQLDRVTDYESVGRGFESLLAYQLSTGFREDPGAFCFYRVLSGSICLRLQKGLQTGALLV